jgi:DNA recombination protein RmuC
MNVLSLVLAFAVGALLGAAVWAWTRRKAPPSDAMLLLQQQMEGLRHQLSESLSAQTRQVHQQLESVGRQVMDSQRTVGDRLDNASRVVGDLQKTLGSLGQASERIYEIGKDLSGLQEILRSPKLRGGLGEYFLGDLLAQILPARHFSLQHAFSSGAVVDAVIHLGDRLVPVDAKFPLENFRRVMEAPTDEERKPWVKKYAADVKKHVDSIAEKYILPDEGTYDFALMYIPAENVYYECVVKNEDMAESLGEYALKRRVVPVSPGSFYAYLQAILLGLKGLQVEENARRLLEGLSRLEGEVRRFADDFDTVGRHLTNARAKYDDAARRLERVQDKLQQASGADAPALPSSSPAPATELLPK